MKRKEAE